MESSGWPVDPGDRPPTRTGAWSPPPPSPPPHPPTTPVSNPPAASPFPPASRTWGRGIVAGLAVAMVMTAVGFGAGRLTDGSSSLVDAVASTPISAPQSDAGTIPADGSEPVAAAAAAVAPSVVQIETSEGLGSGFVYDADGLILTANHVVEGAEQVRVRLADGTTLDGEVLGGDTVSDVAVVKVEASADLPVATLATGESATVGQMAVAVGSPFGLDQTVTAGIVSAVDRTVETPGGALPMLQTDAPINPGNSGGALADRQGRIIGINDSIASQGGGNEGVGFAIPIDTAVAIAERLVSGEAIETGYLGVSTSPDQSAEGADGALVVEVVPASPAAEAGLTTGDLIVALDGSTIEEPADLVAAVRSRAPGDELVVTYERDGESAETTVVLGQSTDR